MSHLNDHKMISHYCQGVHFPRSLAERIFGYLQAKDQTFRDKVIKRQNRWIKKHEQKITKAPEKNFVGGNSSAQDEALLLRSKKYIAELMIRHRRSVDAGESVLEDFISMSDEEKKTQGRGTLITKLEGSNESKEDREET